MSSTTSTRFDSARRPRRFSRLLFASLCALLATGARADVQHETGASAAANDQRVAQVDAQAADRTTTEQAHPQADSRDEREHAAVAGAVSSNTSGATIAVAAGAAAATTAFASSPAGHAAVVDPVLKDGAAFPAPDARARTLLGYASPWTPPILIGIITFLALLVNRLVPKKRRRLGRATLYVACYVGAFCVAALLHGVGAEGWSRRTWFLADVCEVLAVVDVLSILLFDLALTAASIELPDIYRALAVGGVYLLTFVAIIHRAGFDLSSIVATSAVVTAVLGLSLQATLANVIGGVALQIDDSIKVGDWLQLRDGQQGKVKAIRWRSTVLETTNWDTLILANASLLGEQIQVLGQKEDHPRQHREWIYFHVDYRFPPEDVLRAVDDALQSAPIVRVATEPAPTCLCLDLGQPGSIDGTATYGVRYWLTDQGARDSTNSAVRVRIFAALKRAQIPLALPGAALFISNDDKEHKERKEAREIAVRVSVLEAIEMLQCLDHEERLELARRMRMAPFSRGEVITRQGAVAHWLYVLTKGQAEVRVKVSRADEPPLEKLVARLSAPDVFGEMGVMTGEPRTATISAATDVECYRIDRDMFHQLVKNRPELTESISAVMAKRRVQLQSVRDNLGPDDRPGRVAAERSRILAGIQTFFGLDDEE